MKPPLSVDPRNALLAHGASNLPSADGSIRASQRECFAKAFSVVTGSNDATRGDQDCVKDRHAAVHVDSERQHPKRLSQARSCRQQLPARTGPRLPPQVHPDRRPLERAAHTMNIVRRNKRLSVPGRRSAHPPDCAQDGIAAGRNAWIRKVQVWCIVQDQAKLAKGGGGSRILDRSQRSALRPRT